MSVHIHAPSPLRDAPRSPSPQQRRARHTSPSPRRNSQQQQDHIPRPPSRSERLLRDTLMRDELERQAVPPLPLLSRKLSYSSGCSDDIDEEPGTFLFRTPTAAGSGLVMNQSAGHVRQSSQRQPPSHPQGRCTSPTPSRRNLQRSPNSMPTAIPRSPTTSSKSRSRSHSHSHSMSSLPAAACVLTPHETVLRSRLEKVLSMGREEAERRDVDSSERKRRSRDSKGENNEWLWNSQDVCLLFPGSRI
jgi:hypothetical protein